MKFMNCDHYICELKWRPRIWSKLSNVWGLVSAETSASIVHLGEYALRKRFLAAKVNPSGRPDWPPTPSRRRAIWWGALVRFTT